MKTTSNRRRQSGMGALRRPLSGLLCVAALAGCGSHSKSATPTILPQHSRTPGAYNPAVTQSTIHSTVCVRGYTRTIRPPASYTTDLKKKQTSQWYQRSDYWNFEEDHFVPLELGGNPTSTLNLWAEPHTQSVNSDPLENLIREKLCSGALTLAQARQKIVAYKNSNG